MKHRIFFAIIIITVFFISGFIIYANNFLLPTKIKDRIIEQSEKALGKSVQIGRLHYNLIRGFIVEDLSIFDKTKEKTYFSVKEISFQVLFFPLFEKKIIIPLLRINSPQIYITLRQDNTLNIMDLLKKVPAGKEKIKFSLFLLKVDITDGKCQFRDEHADPAYTRDLADLKVGVALDLPDQVKFMLQGKILNYQNNPSFISVNGVHNFLNQKSQCKIKAANLIVNEYLYYLKVLPFSLSEGIIDSVDIDIGFENYKLAFKGPLLVRALQLRKEKFSLVGDYKIEPDITFDLRKGALGYKAGVEISNAQLSGLDYIQTISDIKGNINIQEDKVSAENLKALVLDAPIDIKGTLENFRNPSLKLSVTSTQLDPGKLAAAITKLPEGLTISGNSIVSLQVQGLLSKPPLDITANSEITAGQVVIPALKEPLSDIKGKLSFSADQFSWENLSFVYKQVPYSSSGNLQNFQLPQIDFALSSQGLAVQTSLNIKDNIIKIKDCSGKYFDSDFDIKGSLDLQDNANPLLNIDLESNLSIKDIFRFLPTEVSDNLKKIKPDGLFKIDGSLSGSAKDIKSCAALARISCPTISVYNLKLNSLNGTLKQKDGSLNIPDVFANVYGGSLNAALSINLAAETRAFASKIILTNVDLAKLKADTKIKEKGLAGIMNIRLELEGQAVGLETLKGQGTLSVKEGNLWELNLLKGLGELLFMPIYQKIIFRNADANFVIKDKTVEIANAFLGSEKMDLACVGKIGFDGALDLTLNSEVNEDLIKDAPDLRKFTSAVFGNLLTIKVGGTIQKPEYKVSHGTKEIMKEIKRFFLGK
jgi:hypothetical protein